MLMGHIAHLKYFYEYETCIVILQIVALKILRSTRVLVQGLQF